VTAECRWVRVAGGLLAGGDLLLAPGTVPWQDEMAAGRFEDFLYVALNGRRLEGAAVWDVGAHLGYHTLCFAALVGPQGRVAAFEPNAANLDRLRQNLARNPALAARVRLEDCALSDRDGVDDFFYTPRVDDGTSSGSALGAALIPANRVDFEAQSRTVVPVARADSLVQTGHLPLPALVKVDVEGSEAHVLEGARASLAASRPALLLEIHNVVAMMMVCRFLSDLGYEWRLLDGEHSWASRCHMFATPRRAS
jgi:FkbM family methyltransferase